MNDSGLSQEAGAEKLDEQQRILSEYAEVYDKFPVYVADARRLDAATELIKNINEIDTTRYALCAEIGPASGSTTFYTKVDNDAEISWLPWLPVIVQGTPRPFIGDRLFVSDEGALVLVDTARGLGVDSFINLTIRSKEDETVQNYSDENSVGTLRSLGEVATEQGKQAMLVRDRWSNEYTEPATE